MGPAAVFARTLVQPDGDVVCFVTDRYVDDAALRLEHAQRTAAWFGELHATVDGVTAMTRRATGWVSALVVAATTFTVATLSTLIVGVVAAVISGVVVPVIVRQALRLALGRFLR
ncbi:MAG: hypothetical protein ACRD12_06110 [Acidimicrobiales bacterium]